VPGVKIRSRYAAPGSVGATGKVVSERLNSRAIDCICSVVRSSASRTTANGLPANARSVKTSTTW
jgi:hypothetical protein